VLPFTRRNGKETDWVVRLLKRKLDVSLEDIAFAGIVFRLGRALASKWRLFDSCVSSEVESMVSIDSQREDEAVGDVELTRGFDVDDLDD